MLKLKWILFTGALTLSGFATGEIITADPSSFESGIDISNGFYGSTISTLTIPPYPDDYDESSWPANIPSLDVSSVYAINCSPCAPSTNGKRVFSSTNSFFNPTFDFADEIRRQIAKDTGPGRVGAQALQALFTLPTNSVQVIGGGANNGNFFRMDVWGSTGNLLGSCTSVLLISSTGCNAFSLGDPNPDAPGNPDNSYTRDQWVLSFNSDLANIAFITTGGWAGGQYVQSISYSVAEPTPIALLITGLLGLIRRMKKPNI